MKRTISLFIFTLLLLPLLSQFAEAKDKAVRFREDLAKVVRESGLDSAQIGIAIEKVKDSKPLFQYNENKRFVAASNLKLYTSAAALLSLGPHFNYETFLSAKGPVEAGKLTGDLIIHASGDPTISGYFHEDNNPLWIFQKWAQTLVAKGIKEVRGDIIVDNGGFQDSPYGSGWLLDDIDRCYSAPKNAFSFNNNCLAVTITPGKSVSDPATIVLEPETAYFKVLNKVRTVEADSHEVIKARLDKDTNTILFTGTIPTGEKERIKYIAINKPAEFGAFVFREALAASGVVVSGEIYCTNGGCTKQKVLGPAAFEGETILALYESPELSEILTVINKLSNNLYAEEVFLTIAEAMQHDMNAEGAFSAVVEVLKRAGLETKDLYMVDGSGLSRYDLISPGETVRLLKFMTKKPEFGPFYKSLASTGEEGTLKNWSGKETTKEKLRAKTGTMAHVRNLSGYITAADGELVAFSFLCNNFNVPREVVDKLWNKLLARISGDLSGK